MPLLRSLEWRRRARLKQGTQPEERFVHQEQVAVLPQGNPMASICCSSAQQPGLAFPEVLRIGKACNSGSILSLISLLPWRYPAIFRFS